MANTKEIQKRMKSIQDTMKITSAMYMISSAKLRSAKQKLENTEPYFYALQSAISRLLRHIPDAKSRYFDQREEIPDDQKRRGYIVITADKGLAGAYNHNVIKMAHELFEQGENNKLFVVGELGRQYFTKEGLEVDTEFKYTVQNPSLHRARVITERILDLYNNNELDEVYIIYTKMENSFSMEAEMMKLLPLVKEDFMGKAPVDIPSATQWTSATDMRDRVIYFRTMYDSTIRSIDLRTINFSIVSYHAEPMDNVRQQKIERLKIH